MHGLQAIDAEGDVGEAGVERAAGLAGVEGEAVGDHRHGHAGAGERGGERRPVGAQERLAAGEGDVVAAEGGEVAGDAQRLVGIQLPVAGAAGVRAAVQAGRIAGQRQLPDALPRAVVELVDVFPHGATPPGSQDGNFRAAASRNGFGSTNPA